METGSGATPGENVAKGIGLTTISVMIFGVQDAVAKVLVQDWSPFQITMMRYWAFGLFSLYLVTRKAPLSQAFKSGAPRLQIARGVLLVLDIWLFAWAIESVPLAELQAISLIYPLLVTLFAIPLLGETVGVFRLGAVLVGFVGAMVIVRPGGLPLNAGAFCALGAALTYSLYIVMTRKATRVDGTATCMVYVGVIGMVVTTIVGVFFWEPMDWRGVALAAVVMVTTVSAHSLMMKALSMAPASTLQPFNYLSLPWAIVLSIIVFGHYIDFISLIGALVITGAGLVIWVRERERKVRISATEITPPGKE